MAVSNQYSLSSENNDITVSHIIEVLDSHNYLADEELATALFLLLKLHKPILLEGPPGIGKTELALVLAE